MVPGRNGKRQVLKDVRKKEMIGKKKGIFNMPTT